MNKNHLPDITQEQADKLLDLLRETFPDQAVKFGNVWQYADDDGIGPKAQFVELWIAGSDWIYYGN